MLSQPQCAMTSAVRPRASPASHSRPRCPISRFPEFCWPHARPPAPVRREFSQPASLVDHPQQLGLAFFALDWPKPTLYKGCNRDYYEQTGRHDGHDGISHRVHFGHALGMTSPQRDALTFLRGLSCETLYLVGDIVDGWALQRHGLDRDRRAGARSYLCAGRERARAWSTSPAIMTTWCARCCRSSASPGSSCGSAIR